MANMFLAKLFYLRMFIRTTVLSGNPTYLYVIEFPVKIVNFLQSPEKANHFPVAQQSLRFVKTSENKFFFLKIIKSLSLESWYNSL